MKNLRRKNLSALKGRQHNEEPENRGWVSVNYERWQHCWCVKCTSNLLIMKGQHVLNTSTVIKFGRDAEVLFALLVW